MNFIKLTDTSGRTFYLNLDKVMSMNLSEYHGYTIISCDTDMQYHRKESPEEILQFNQ